MQKQIYPPHIIEFSKEQLLSESPRKTYIIYVIIIIMFFAAIISLPFISVDVTVQGSGIIRPTTEKQEIKSAVSGIIEKVETKEGNDLDEGDVVLTINSDKLDKKIVFMQLGIEEDQTTEKDLALLTERFDEIEVQTLNTDLYMQEMRQFNNEIKPIQIREKNLKSDLIKLKKLYIGKMITTTTLEAKQRELKQLKNDRQILTGKYLTKWQSDKKNITEKIENKKVELAALLKEKEMYKIKTPVKGSIEQFQNITKGKYVQAGETICVISPASELIAETYIYPKDIGLISKRNKINILIDSFNYNDWGTLSGQITDISNDFILVNNNPAFKIRCTLDRDHLQLKNGFKGKIKKGMTFQSRFIVAQRTLFQLLFDNVNDWLNPYNS